MIYCAGIVFIVELEERLEVRISAEKRFGLVHQCLLLGDHWGASCCIPDGDWMILNSFAYSFGR